MKQVLFFIIGTAFLLFFSTKSVMAIDPPEDEASFAYNYFDGGGITVHGPAIILKKAMKGRMSIEAGGRMDMVSSASIDVLTQGSKVGGNEFTDERKEVYFGGSHIWGDSLFSGTYTMSDESDYTSKTLSLGLTHDLLDRNLTVNLRVARSRDDVGKNGDPAFGEEHFNRTAYSIGLTQSLTPRWLAQFNYEVTADEGYINSPYRNALVGTAWVPEVYPNARTGQAWVIRSTHGFLRALNEGGGLKSSVQVSYRYYQDTFDVQSHTGKLSYQHRFSSTKLFGIFYRYYQQTAASFYGDVLPSTQLFKARDKELSTFSDHGVGVSFKYEPHQKKWGWIEKPYLKMGYSFLMFEYDDFSDPRSGQLYSWEANVFQISLGSTY